MPSLTISDLTNAKIDTDHIAAIATSTGPTATDRLGNEKLTMQGAVDTIKAFTSRGAWAATTLYASKDLVSNAGSWYVCVVPHTSSAAFATDTASKWRVYQGVLAENLAASNGAALAGFLGQTLYTMALNSLNFSHKYGGQLRKLHTALTNPLEQQTTISMMGDSITWGTGATGSAVSTPRDGTLADPRDYYATKSYVNEFKRFIAAKYFNSAAPTLSNWSYSSSGESTATYSKTVQLYTNLPPFSAVTGTGTWTSSDVSTGGALLGYRHGIALTPGATAEFTFPFTGTTFDVVYTSITGTTADYELFVDGVSQGTFVSDTGSTVNQQRRTHTFGYVRNKTIKIKAKYPAVGGSGNKTLWLEAIEISKKCTITNQGIIGTNSRASLVYDFGAYGPTCMTADTNFVFVQLGTNDRSNTFPTYNQPNGANNFKRNMVALLAAITPTADAILMCAGPATADSSPTYTIGMRSIRDTLDSIAKESALDFIDNYSMLDGFDLSLVLADGLHPNDAGHGLMAGNIKNALMTA